MVLDLTSTYAQKLWVVDGFYNWMQYISPEGVLVILGHTVRWSPS